ncbi:hypothetical protein PR001_g257 [Phytophthora rubi]|uniref:C2 NT-type domain-containing protein n=1 Tax=Phytophthora rubi TaxID=129364 RepID=A0A6A3NVM9_9STRA|nr:hypothetical protein PR002_g281 [Phytophthora rubi]KAE9052667.1 hypothetical protein PR001_g257 [Phytophthora rubi]
MSRLVQIAQRSNKAPVGFKVQLVVHRLNANLAVKHDTELVAVIMGRKKKIPSKPAVYQPADPGDDGSLRRLNGSRAIQASHSRSGDTGEVVWGDMVAFSSTLYMAKSGLFQAKRFQIHINTVGEHGKTLAVFEFDLAELVPVSKDSGKESVRLTTTKCTDDPRACMSITVVSSRVNRERDGVGHERSYVEDSTSEMGSEMSAYTNNSRASSLASNCRRNIDIPIPEHVGLGEGKADAIRTAGHPTTSDEAVSAADSARDELVKALQNLEAQLRESEAANVKLEATIEQKDREIERLTRMAAGIGGSSSEAEDGVMQVDFLVYMTLKEQFDALKLEHEACQMIEKNAAAASGMYTIADVESEEEENKGEEGSRPKETIEDDASEASSANEYVDAEEPHLVAEVSALKQLLATQRNEADQLNRTIQELTSANNELEAQLRELRAAIEQKEEELQLSTAALQRVESVRNEVGDTEAGEAEAQAQALETALSDNKRLERQLLKFDGAMTAMEEEKARLLEQLREAEIASANAQEEVVKVQNALEQLDSKSQTLSKKLQEVDQARERAEETVVAAEATIGTLQQQVRDVSTQLQETQQELESLRDHQLTASAVALEEATTKHQALERLWEDVKMENERLQARVEELEFRLAQSEANGDEKAAELQSQVDEVKREAEALHEELEALRASKTQIESESHECELQLHEATETHRRMSVDHDERLSSEIMAREELLTRLQEQVEQTEKLSAELSSKVVALEQELDYFQGELIESKMKVAQLTQNNDELAMRNRHLEKDAAANSKK